jgi:threonyl-tRNA synthetase
MQNKGHDDHDQIDIQRHSAAHLLAMAVKQIRPDALFGVGPAVEDGFYYDIESKDPITEADLSQIEKRMKKLISQKIPFERSELSISDAKKRFHDQKYKLELIDDLASEGEKKVSVYTSKDFSDLCQGPHVDNTSEINANALTITRLAGAYWKGDETREQLTRIYGILFETKEELDTYRKRIEEAKKRDHRKIGKELGLFTIDPDVGLGLPLYKPRGAMIFNLLKRWFEDEQLKRGYVPVITPHIGRKTLWEKSGHWGFYNDSMYPPLELGQTLEDYQDNRTVNERETYLLKPMNCPFHVSIFKDDQYSYRDLPLRYYEFGTVYRYEQKGELGGLMRVRGFTQDDAHIICSKDQLENEMKNVIDFTFFVLRDTFGFEVEVYASFRDPKKEKYLGNDEKWDTAENIIAKILEEKDIPFTTELGEAAFYGPKMDFKVKDSLGRQWQLSTIQFDFNLPERFAMTFKNASGEDEQPYMIHRALFGSIDRFMGILIEHYAGAFPFWLSPVQIGVIPISDKFTEYSKKVCDQLTNNGFRTDLYDQSETLGKRIRIAQKEKIPYMLIVGEKEMKDGTVAVRTRENGDMGTEDINTLITRLTKEL